MIDLLSTTAQARAWAAEVGEIQKQRFRSPNLKMTFKSSPSDVVTDVDKESENMLVKKIQQSFPTHSILSEECGLIEAESDYQWVLDPLDGTSNYANGLPVFAISIALRQKTQTLLGVVHAPILEETYWASQGHGAYLNGRDIHISSKKTLRESILATGFPYDMEHRPNNNLRYFMQISRKIRGIRRFGAAAYDLSLVAAGFLDGFWELGLNEWDYLAANLIVKEAGGEVHFHTDSDIQTLFAGPATIVNQIRKEHEKVDASQA